MRKTKTQKGITLVALIITIIILLILAVTTIGSIRDSKIIEHAQEAGSEYTQKKEEEELKLAVMDSMLDKNSKFNLNTFKSEYMPDNFVVNNDGTLTSNTGNKFLVDEKGNITFIGGKEQEEGGGGNNNPPSSGTITVEKLKDLYNDESIMTVVDINNYNQDGGYYPMVDDATIKVYPTNKGTAIVKKDGKSYTFILTSEMQIMDIVETPTERETQNTINTDKVLVNFEDFIYNIVGDRTYYTCDIVGSPELQSGFYVYNIGIDSSYKAVLLDGSKDYQELVSFNIKQFENVERVYIPVSSNYYGSISCSVRISSF